MEREDDAICPQGGIGPPLTMVGRRRQFSPISPSPADFTSVKERRFNWLFEMAGAEMSFPFAESFLDS